MPGIRLRQLFGLRWTVLKRRLYSTVFGMMGVSSAGILTFVFSYAGHVLRPL